MKGVKIKYAAGLLNVEGPKGKLKLDIPEEVVLEVSEKEIKVNQGKGEVTRVNAFHGLYRALINNMIVGVAKGYEKRLENIKNRYGEDSNVYQKCVKLVNNLIKNYFSN